MIEQDLKQLADTAASLLEETDPDEETTKLFKAKLTKEENQHKMILECAVITIEGIT